MPISRYTAIVNVAFLPPSIPIHKNSPSVWSVNGMTVGILIHEHIAIITTNRAMRAKSKVFSFLFILFKSNANFARRKCGELAVFVSNLKPAVFIYVKRNSITFIISANNANLLAYNKAAPAIF